MTNALVCFLIAAVCLIVAVRCFVANQVYRGAIDAALAAAQGGPIDVPERVKLLVSEIPEGSSWGVAGVGRHQLPMAKLALSLGGNARVGLEDNIYVRKGVLAQGSWELCAEARNIAKEVGRPLATPDEARKILSLPAR